MLEQSVLAWLQPLSTTYWMLSATKDQEEALISLFSRCSKDDFSAPSSRMTAQHVPGPVTSMSTWTQRALVAFICSEAELWIPWRQSLAWRQLSDSCWCHLPALLTFSQHCFSFISTFSLADLHRVWQHKRHESFHGDNPGRDGCAKAFAQERTQRNIFPLLDVTGWEENIQSNAGKHILAIAHPSDPWKSNMNWNCYPQPFLAVVLKS